MKQIDKEYTRPFLIEPTKFRRIVDQIHERLGDHANATTHDSFEVFMSGNRREVMASVDAVLALDNSSKQKIQRLMVICSAASAGASRPQHEVQVDFGRQKATGTSVTTKVVEISVRSDVPGWANRTLSEVEEQVERTWLPRPHVLGILLLVAMFFLMGAILYKVSSVGYPPLTLDILRSMWLRDRDVERLEHMVSQNRIMTDDEIREIVTRQIRNILDDAKPPQQAKGQTRKAVITLVPLLILLACVAVLFTCYPSNVFLWGDEIGRYARILQRRKTAWGIIIGSVVVGIVGNLLSTNLISILPP